MNYIFFLGMKFNKHSYKSNKLNKIKILKSYMSQIRRCYIHTYCVYVCVCVYIYIYIYIYIYRHSVSHSLRNPTFL